MTYYMQLLHPWIDYTCYVQCLDMIDIVTDTVPSQSDSERYLAKLDENKGLRCFFCGKKCYSIIKY